jgi:hypothetical protein
MPKPLITKAIAVKRNSELANTRVIDPRRRLEKIQDLPVQPISGLNSTSLWLKVKYHK